jgi:predicted type IV restriction endonuclease
MKSGKIYHSYSEEWVRQHVVRFLWKKISLINVEGFKVNGLRKRYDVVVFNLMVPFYSNRMQSAVQASDQIARYNMTMNAQYLMVTNGLNHYF